MGETEGEVFDLERIKKLVRLMKEHDLSEIDLHQGEQRIRLRRGGSAPAPERAPAPQGAVERVAAPPVQAAAPAAASKLHIIRSPMPGTFYSRPKPDSPSYVKVGDRIDLETTVCLIEAMKTFNPIPAGVKGKVVAVLIDNETGVDFGAPLFEVDTNM